MYESRGGALRFAPWLVFNYYRVTTRLFGIHRVNALQECSVEFLFMDPA